MNIDRRMQVTERIFDGIRKLSIAKSKDYATDGDTLRNFRRGAALVHGTPFSYLLNLVTKQFVSIADAIERNPEYPATSVDSLREKTRDVIAYMILLECLLDDLAPTAAAPECGASDAVPVIAVSGVRYAHRHTGSVVIVDSVLDGIVSYHNVANKHKTNHYSEFQRNYVLADEQADPCTIGTFTNTNQWGGGLGVVPTEAIDVALSGCDWSEAIRRACRMIPREALIDEVRVIFVSNDQKA